MKKKIFFTVTVWVCILAIAGITAAGITGCEKPNTLELSVESLDFPFAGGSKSFTVTSNANWTVSVSAQNWLTVTPTSGSKNGAVTVTATANTIKSKQVATITVSCGDLIKTVSIEQEAFVESLNVSQSSLNFEADAGEQTLTVTANTNWTVSSNATAWLTVSPASGSSEGTVTVRAAANPVASGRSATITVKGTDLSNTINVTQAAAAASMTVDTESLSFSAAAGEKTFNITANTSWNTTRNSADWFTLSPSSGSSSSPIRVSTTANTSITERTATITVSGGGISRNINMTQAGAAPFLTVSTNAMSFSSANERHSFTIASNIAWVVNSSESWATMSPSSGSNNGTVIVETQANTATTERKATITVSGGGIERNITVTQSPVGVLTVSASVFILANAASSERTFNITSNISWEVSSNVSWITATPSSGSNNGTVTVKFDANTSTTQQRTAIITISGGGIKREISVTQPPASTLNVSPSYRYFSSALADQSSFSVTSNVNWTVRSSASWLTFSPSSGMNNGTVNIYTALNNSTVERSATLTITGGGVTRTVDVSQAGAVASGSISFWTSRDFGCGYITITISGQGSRTLNKYFTLGSPSGCGVDGTATFANLPVGTYYYSASCSGRTWSGSVTRTASCHRIQLQ